MNDYITPDEVTAPRQRWHLIRVLETGAEEDFYDERVAIAIGTWDGDKVLAMRWNGNKDWRIGSPQSRGLPTWFIIPKRLNEAVIGILSKDNQRLVQMLLEDSKK
ncbi:MAG: hypothetical protein ABSH11_00750 [Verrucomicrobiota bacterium]